MTLTQYDSGLDGRKRDRNNRDVRSPTHSSKMNRHSDDKRRNIRRQVYYSDSSSEDDNVSNNSEVSVIRSTRAPRSSYKGNSSNEAKSGNRILMGGVLRK